MIFDTIPAGPLQTNCYLIGDETAGVCAVVDPGGNASEILDMVKKSHLELKMLLLTHGHYDHVGAIAPILAAYPSLPVYIHEKELCPAGTREPRYFLPHLGPNQRTYGEGDTLDLGSLKIQVLHTPGHSAGSVVLLVEDVMLCGDTLFCRSCGRYDLPGGDWWDILNSLSRLGRLEGDYKVCPGHGPLSTLDYEREHNPYLKQAMNR